MPRFPYSAAAAHLLQCPRCEKSSAPCGRSVQPESRSRRKRISHFTHDDNVRVLANDMTQRFAKGQTDFRIDRALGDAIDQIFDRLLGRDDARLEIVEIVDTAIQSGGFASSGRTRDNYNAA